MHPILDESDMYVANPDIIRDFKWASHFSHVYTLDYMLLQVELGDMAQKIITIIIFISVDIDNYHDKWQIFISFKFKARCLLQSESFRNQTINFP